MPLLEWSHIVLASGALIAFGLAGWMLRQSQRLTWIWAYCTLLASGIGLLFAERYAWAQPPAVAISSLFSFLWLIAAFHEAGRRVPRWVLPAGAALALARASLVAAGRGEASAWLEITIEPLAALGAAWVFHRHVAPRGLTPFHWLIAPGLVLVAGIEAWDGVRDLRYGNAPTLWVPWVLVGAPLAAFMVVAKIDELRRERLGTEEQLREAEQRFRRISEYSNDVIAEAGPDGRITYASPNLRRVLGYEPEELIGRHVNEVAAFVDRDSAPAATQRRWRLDEIGARSPFPDTWRGLRKNGSWSWFETEASVFHGPDGELRAIGVSRDIGDRIEAFEQRRELELQMQQAQKLESLGFLAGGIAHDFNNLLVGILGNAELAMHELRPDAPARGLVEEILKASERASELTHQLLAYAGKAEARLETVELESLVHEMIRLVRLGLPSSARVEEELSPEKTWLTADPTQLRQVAMNLLTNAADALGDEAGTVTVRTSCERLDERDFERCYAAEGLEPGDFACLEVRDTGCGMAPDAMERIFDPFFTTKFEGRGLGLAAVLGIVRSHCGAIQVESDAGAGTCFRVFLPLVAQPGTAARPEEVREAWRGQGIVLVVDDEDIVRKVATRELERLGFRTLSASSGSEALKLFRAQAGDIHCVLLDVTMPEMDGEAVFHELRQLREEIPVLFMSGHSARDIEERLREKTGVGRLRKPFTESELAQGVRELIG